MRGETLKREHAKVQRNKRHAQEEAEGEAKLCGVQEVDDNASTEPLSEAESANEAQEDGEASIGDLFPMDLEGAPEPTTLAGHFGTAQLRDPNLANALQQVKMVDGSLIEGVNQERRPVVPGRPSLPVGAEGGGGVWQPSGGSPRNGD
ncbi:hypothetical protein SKAU_G00282450 [Synaphobranchus kaupii]|uniref:Uncharacterized protein n=1 Tax=Synaphobranchus kaupii TaxID=118154 RepID=A0A9Q1EXK0_SYNKA|nr:hypothetical protein SKAU_G00282450 [Synaphobranchus kaupii]